MEISLVIKMEQVKFETSMKNIPLGGKKEYAMQLTHSIRKVVYAMSWAAFIFLNDIQCEEKETCSTNGIQLNLLFFCILSSLPT